MKYLTQPAMVLHSLDQQMHPGPPSVNDDNRLSMAMGCSWHSLGSRNAAAHKSFVKVAEMLIDLWASAMRSPLVVVAQVVAARTLVVPQVVVVAHRVALGLNENMQRLHFQV